MLASDPEATAVLCGNDDLALGVMRALQKAGRAIPDDVSVAGFDDTPMSEFLMPPLTTVRMDFAELGRACFAVLLALMERKDALPRAQWPEPELIIRESTGPLPAPRGSGPTRGTAASSTPAAMARRAAPPVSLT